MTPKHMVILAGAISVVVEGGFPTLFAAGLTSPPLPAAPPACRLEDARFPTADADSTITLPVVFE